MHAVQEEAQDKTSSTKGKPIPTELRNEEAKLRQEIDLEDENTAGMTLWDCNFC
ncbi:hypothetical protein RchiOBHm_Chr2g0100391 [Rosa chinensis]|uniref:Uncharacterized protein n=1 Tax=Rosa chinensis TaxID=74649 RepID=A0A2P6RM61_ROSCH|nr:hypothetical protein RchiOBHm_Chr2g0100391 [Rosa chinensis]